MYGYKVVLKIAGLKGYRSYHDNDFIWPVGEWLHKDIIEGTQLGLFLFATIAAAMEFVHKYGYEYTLIGKQRFDNIKYILCKVEARNCSSIHNLPDKLVCSDLRIIKEIGIMTYNDEFTALRLQRLWDCRPLEDDEIARLREE